MSVPKDLAVASVPCKERKPSKVAFDAVEVSLVLAMEPRPWELSPATPDSPLGEGAPVADFRGPRRRPPAGFCLGRPIKLISTPRGGIANSAIMQRRFSKESTGQDTP